MATDKPPDLVARARAGDPAALQALRDSWRGDRTPRSFLVDAMGIIDDPRVTGPRWRRDVFREITPFVSRSGATRGMPQTQYAIADIHGCPPLVARFAQCALGHIAELEVRLVLDDTLSRADQRQLRQQITELDRPGRSPWENWMYQTPIHDHAKFETIIERWLSEPVQLTEADWFRQGWQQQRYGLAAAYTTLMKMHHELFRFLGLGIKEVSCGSGRSINAACLKVPVHDANRWAELADLPLRFEPARPASSPAPAKSASQKAAQKPAPDRNPTPADAIAARPERTSVPLFTSPLVEAALKIIDEFAAGASSKSVTTPRQENAR